jgi:aspartyl-tRNA(Asn)/glutamyl-tRNA(Gln) amidotransferase subunit A
MPTAAPSLHFLTVAQAAKLFRRRKLSPVELAEALLRRIDSLNPRLNAYLTVTHDLALRQARAAERRQTRGQMLGPLDGIPVGIKDLFATKGVRTTGGSRILRDWVPDHDAVVVQRLSAAGAVTLGKLHMHEFAFGITNVNPHYGPARNPWDTERMTGGSSGGSGAAVAAGLALAALGSDTGGSIRIPSALCGVYGIKPTYGRVSRRGALALSWSLDHVGPMARTPEDAALLLNAIAGHDALDPGSASEAAPDFAQGLRKGVRGVRVGVLPLGSTVDGEADAAFRAACATLEGLGARLDSVTIPSLDLSALANTVILSSEAAELHQKWIDERPGDYGDDVFTRMLTGRLIPSALLVKAQRVRTVIRQELAGLFQRVDLLVWPSVPVPAPLIAEQGAEHGEAHRRIRASITRYTPLANLAGLPAASVPCGFTNTGLPLGLQIIGRPWQEALVLRASQAYHDATDWRTRSPQL